MLELNYEDLQSCFIHNLAVANGTPDPEWTMPASLAGVPPAVIADLHLYPDSTVWQGGYFHVSHAQCAAMVRGDIPTPCGCAGLRYDWSTFTHVASGTRLNIQTKVEKFGPEDHPCYCVIHEAWTKADPGAPAWLPDRFTSHRTVSLAPYALSPLSPKSQELAIAMLPDIVKRLFCKE